jgi:hypothetical protein
MIIIDDAGEYAVKRITKRQWKGRTPKIIERYRNRDKRTTSLSGSGKKEKKKSGLSKLDEGLEEDSKKRKDLLRGKL